MAYQDLVRQLAKACRFIAHEFSEHRLPTTAKDPLQAIAEATPHLPLTHSISAVVILAQIRSMVIDLLELTGMDYLAAREWFLIWTEPMA